MTETEKISDLEVTGSFRCSNHLINQLFEDILMEQRKRFASISAAADKGVLFFANSGSYNMYTAPLYARLLEETECFSTRLMLLRQMFRKYSDTGIVKKYLPGTADFLMSVEKKSPRFPIVSDCGIGDPFNFNDPTPPDLLNTAWFAGMNLMCSRLAAAVGENSIAEERMSVYRQTKTAFLKEFYTDDMRFKGESQSSKVLTVYFDLTPDDSDLWALLVESLLKDVEKKCRNHFSTGSAGLPLLLPVLTKSEALDTAYKLLLQSSFPSWLAPVISGKSVGENFDFYAFGAVVEWFYEEICGIQPDPDLRHFKLAPRFGRFLDWAEAEYKSVYGLIVSKWHREGDDYIHEFTIPPETEAVVRNKLYTSGTYTIKIKHY